MKACVKSIWLISILLLVLYGTAFSSEGARGLRLTAKIPDFKPIDLYQGGSYALLIGISQYTAGWPNLEAIATELDEVENELKKHGFEITRLDDPDSKLLRQGFEDFINTYGFNEQNRLLFFFSGHGHTRKNKGYLVPSDAPDPRENDSEFARKSMGMDQILTYARRIESKHALFLFDSCFSGTVFKVKALPKNPPHINSYIAKPVRQFISAGGSGETVPAKSVFTPSFVRAIRGAGDLDKDGYITGTELGMYLRRQVMHYGTGQTPQYGKIKDPSLDEGDFIILAGGKPSNYIDSAPSTVVKSMLSGLLKITSNPPNASVYVDGKFSGETPVELQDISPGKKFIQLVKDGYLTVSKTKEIRANRLASIDFTLMKQRNSGWITIATTPNDAEIRLLNSDAKYTSDMELDPGKYQVEISKPGYATVKKWIRVTPGSELNLDIALNKVVQKKMPKEILKQGSFSAFSSGIVRDRKTGLMWAASDNGKNISWQEAKQYCESYRGGDYDDWRMPTQSELSDLYDNGIRLIHNNGNHIIRVTHTSFWAAEVKDSEAAGFTFGTGFPYWKNRSSVNLARVLPVRDDN